MRVYYFNLAVILLYSVLFMKRVEKTTLMLISFLNTISVIIMFANLKFRIAVEMGFNRKIRK